MRARKASAAGLAAVLWLLPPLQSVARASPTAAPKASAPSVRQGLSPRGAVLAAGLADGPNPLASFRRELQASRYEASLAVELPLVFERALETVLERLPEGASSSRDANALERMAVIYELGRDSLSPASRGEVKRRLHDAAVRKRLDWRMRLMAAELAGARRDAAAIGALEHAAPFQVLGAEAAGDVGREVSRLSRLAPARAGADADAVERAALAGAGRAVERYRAEVADGRAAVDGSSRRLAALLRGELARSLRRHADGRLESAETLASDLARALAPRLAPALQDGLRAASGQARKQRLLKWGSAGLLFLAMGLAYAATAFVFAAAGTAVLFGLPAWFVLAFPFLAAGGLVIELGFLPGWPKGELTFVQSASRVGLWLALTAAFGAGVWLWLGPAAFAAWGGAYGMELALSLDNLIVFAVTLSATNKASLSAKDKARALAMAVGLAMVLRVLFIAGGMALMSNPVTFLVFGGWLIWTAVKLALEDVVKSAEKRTGRPPRWAKAFHVAEKMSLGLLIFGLLAPFAVWAVPAAVLAAPLAASAAAWVGLLAAAGAAIGAGWAAFAGAREAFFPSHDEEREEGEGGPGSLAGVGAYMAGQDVIFATDSVPTVLAFVSDISDPVLRMTIAMSSNVFAVLLLRSLFGLLDVALKTFHALKPVVIGLLAFVGAKLIFHAMHAALHHVLPAQVYGLLSLVFGSWAIPIVGVLLAGAILWSLARPLHAGGLAEAFDEAEGIKARAALEARESRRGRWTLPRDFARTAAAAAALSLGVLTARAADVSLGFAERYAAVRELARRTEARYEGAADALLAAGRGNAVTRPDMEIKRRSLAAYQAATGKKVGLETPAPELWSEILADARGTVRVLQADVDRTSKGDGPLGREEAEEVRLSADAGYTMAFNTARPLARAGNAPASERDFLEAVSPEAYGSLDAFIITDNGGWVGGLGADGQPFTIARASDWSLRQWDGLAGAAEAAGGRLLDRTAPYRATILLEGTDVGGERAEAARKRLAAELAERGVPGYVAAHNWGDGWRLSVARYDKEQGTRTLLRLAAVPGHMGKLRAVRRLPAWLRGLAAFALLRPAPRPLPPEALASFGDWAETGGLDMTMLVEGSLFFAVDDPAGPDREGVVRTPGSGPGGTFGVWRGLRGP